MLNVTLYLLLDKLKTYSHYIYWGLAARVHSLFARVNTIKSVYFKALNTFSQFLLSYPVINMVRDSNMFFPFHSQV